MSIEERTSAENIAKFRADVIDGNAEGEFCAKDIEKVKTDDEYVKRFLKHQGTFEKAVNMAKDALKFRKEFEVENITLESFPKEMLELGSLYNHGKDKDGSLMLIFHVKKHKKKAEFATLYKKLVIYLFEKLDKEGSGKPITVIFDCIGSGLSNMDMDIMRFIVDSFLKYYPSFLNNILVIDIPWVLNAAWKIIKLWLPEESISKVKFIDKKGVLEFVDVSQLLKCMGGEDEFEYKYVPSS